MEGSVYAGGGCVGNPPKNDPGFRCSAPVAGEDVTVVISSSEGLAVSVRTGRSGRYWLALPPGIYMVAAWKSKWEEVSSGGIRTPHPAEETEFLPVRISRGQTVRIDIVFPSFAI